MDTYRQMLAATRAAFFVLGLLPLPMLGAGCGGDADDTGGSEGALGAADGWLVQYRLDGVQLSCGDVQCPDADWSRRESSEAGASVVCGWSCPAGDDMLAVYQVDEGDPEACWALLSSEAGGCAR